MAFHADRSRETFPAPANSLAGSYRANSDCGSGSATPQHLSEQEPAWSPAPGPELHIASAAAQTRMVSGGLISDSADGSYHEMSGT
jgi:hypothetical protein